MQSLRPSAELLDPNPYFKSVNVKISNGQSKRQQVLLAFPKEELFREKRIQMETQTAFHRGRRKGFLYEKGKGAVCGRKEGSSLGAGTPRHPLATWGRAACKDHP